MCACADFRFEWMRTNWPRSRGWPGAVIRRRRPGYGRPCALPGKWRVRRRSSASSARSTTHRPMHTRHRISSRCLRRSNAAILSHCPTDLGSVESCVPSGLALEVGLVDALDVECLPSPDADAVVVHVARERRTVDEHDATRDATRRTRQASAEKAAVVMNTPLDARCPSRLPANFWRSGRHRAAIAHRMEQVDDQPLE